jgi:Fur family transcriptional regulator, ferric uptake regulator
MESHVDRVLRDLRARGYRMTSQRRAIVTEVLRARDHISPQAVVRRVRRRLPGTNPSTVYRTLDLLEELGIVAHAHFEEGAEYHRTESRDHLHLVCSGCGRLQSLSEAEAEPVRAFIARRSGFEPDLTHFAISGLCADCRRSAAQASRSGTG